MKHGVFFLFWAAMLAFFFAAVGVLALLGYPDAEISFWTGRAIQSRTGKIVWIVISIACFIVCLSLAVSRYRRKK